MGYIEVRNGSGFTLRMENDNESLNPSKQICVSCNDDWIKAATKTAPKAPPVCCAKGNTLRTGLTKTTNKFYYGYVCLDNIKEHAVWAKQDATGSWFFPESKGGE